jgi:hypothetical protein
MKKNPPDYEMGHRENKIESNERGGGMITAWVVLDDLSAEVT